MHAAASARKQEADSGATDFVLAEGKGEGARSGEPTRYRDLGDRLPLQEQVSHMSLNRH